MTGADLKGLSVQHLCREFAGARVVDDVSFVVDEGESVGLIGESGSGKTTIARLITGLQNPTGGTVRFAGEPVSRSTNRGRLNWARQIQMVFQDPFSSFDPRQPVADSITEVLGLHFPELRPRERALRTAELLESVGLEEASGSQRPRDLSGGQCQRAAIARALSVRPRLCILDEAVSALDVSIQAQILNLLSDIRSATGMSFLFISHDLAVVRHITQRSIVLLRGQIVEDGDNRQVLDEPTHWYTQSLRAAVPRRDWNIFNPALHPTSENETSSHD